VQKGTWTPAPSGPPTVVSLSPSSGSGTTQGFTAVYSDPNGTAYLTDVRILFNTAVSGASGCYVYYYSVRNKLYLENDAGTGLSAGIKPGSSATLSNSQCTLVGTGSSYNVSGTNGALIVALTFSGTFTGLKNAYLHSPGPHSYAGTVAPSPEPFALILGGMLDALSNAGRRCSTGAAGSFLKMPWPVENAGHANPAQG
jgi:hypothetical protein